MKIALIAAVARNNVIGREGRLPWPKLEDDMRQFRALTEGKAVIMGRATFQSLSGPLKGRVNIVLTRNPGWCHPNVLVAESVEHALFLARAARNEIMVIGGGEIYRAFLPVADHIYLTRVDRDIHGDTYFPDLTGWEETDATPGDPGCSYVTLVRPRPGPQSGAA